MTCNTDVGTLNSVWYVSWSACHPYTEYDANTETVCIHPVSHIPILIHFDSVNISW